MADIVRAMVTDRPTPDGSGPESAWPVRIFNTKLRDYIARLNRVWIEGQITELNRRSGGLVFLTLRDPAADISVSVSADATVAARVSPELAAGQHVVMLVQCEYWVRNGRFTLRATDIRPVGIGVLLAALEARRAALAAEGLFDSARKRPLPLLPNRIGLVTGVNAQALHDVVTNAQRRWPAAQFEILTGPVQGSEAVGSVIGRLRRLDADEDVDVIIIARGGGS
jgi:exodeoxyribonuclease VII large subunit